MSITGKSGFGAHGGVAAIGADHQIGGDVAFAVRRAHAHADDAAAAGQELRDLRFHEEMERRKLPRFAGNENRETPIAA